MGHHNLGLPDVTRRCNPLYLLRPCSVTEHQCARSVSKAQRYQGHTTYGVSNLCNKNQQNAHFLHSCFNLVIVSSTCFEHPSVRPQEEMYMQFYGIMCAVLCVATFQDIYRQLHIISIHHLQPFAGQ
jgi:hypothetical protein